MIKAIYIATESGGSQQALTQANLVVNAGIEGDRNYGRSDWDGQNVTFIEIEEIDRFNNDFSQDISWDAPRRNVVTQGVRLNDLVGKEFSIGEVRFRGVELCEPCASLGEMLETETLKKKDVVKAFVNKGGLYADILNSGIIEVDMPIKI